MIINIPKSEAHNTRIPESKTQSLESRFQSILLMLQDYKDIFQNSKPSQGLRIIKMELLLFHWTKEGVQMLVFNFCLEMFPVPLKRSSDAFRCFSDCVHMQHVSWQTLHPCRRAFGQNKFCWVYSFLHHACKSFKCCSMNCVHHATWLHARPICQQQLVSLIGEKLGNMDSKSWAHSFCMHERSSHAAAGLCASMQQWCLHDCPKCRQESWAPWRSQNWFLVNHFQMRDLKQTYQWLLDVWMPVGSSSIGMHTKYSTYMGSGLVHNL